MTMQRYRVEHETRYEYSAPVSQSWQLAHLVPRTLPWQRVRDCKISISPQPTERHDAADSFGNAVTHFGLHAPHRELFVRMQCDVEVGERPAVNTGPGVAWETVRDTLRQRDATVPLQPDELMAVHMSEPTAMVPFSDAARDYALPSFAAGRPWLEAVNGLMGRIHADFEFEPGATTVSTSVDEVLSQRRGVCQDFAHLMLSCLRSLDLPARYVSGYLLTEPPPGQARLMGADATHAWVAAYSPVFGWVEFDPTNDQRADQRYITLAWGADFADVIPLRGVILGGGEQEMAVAVSVVPAEA